MIILKRLKHLDNYNCEEYAVPSHMKYVLTIPLCAD